MNGNWSFGYTSKPPEDFIRFHKFFSFFRWQFECQTADSIPNSKWGIGFRFFLTYRFVPNPANVADDMTHIPLR